MKLSLFMLLLIWETWHFQHIILKREFFQLHDIFFIISHHSEEIYSSPAQPHRTFHEVMNLPQCFWPEQKILWFIEIFVSLWTTVELSITLCDFANIFISSSSTIFSDSNKNTRYYSSFTLLNRPSKFDFQRIHDNRLRFSKYKYEQ